MKRFFTLLSLCCLLFGTAGAQGVSFENLSETKYYYMKSGRNYVANSSWNRGYIVMKSDGTNLTLQGITNPHSAWTVTDYQTTLDESTAGKEAMWGVVKYTDINNTTYAIIYNAKNGKCFKSTTATSDDLAVMALAEEVGYYKFETITGTYVAANSYRIRNVSTSNANYMLALAPGQTTSSNKCVAAYSGTDTDGGVPICFIEVPESNTNGAFDNNIRKLVELRDVYGNARLAQNLMTGLGTYSSNEQFTALGTSLTTFRSTPTVANATSLQTAYSALVPLNCGNEFCYEIYHYKYGKSGGSNESGGRGMLAYDSNRPANTQRPATVGVSYTGYTSKGYSNPCDEGVSTLWGLYKNSAGTYYIYNEGYASRMMTAAAPSAWTEDLTALSIASNSSNQANTFAFTSPSATNNALGISLGYFQSGSKDEGDIRTQGNLTDDGVKLMVRIAGLANSGAQNIIKAQLRRAEYPVAGYGYVGGLPTQAVVTGENRTAENAQLILDAQPLAIEAGKNYLVYSGRSGSTDAYVTADPIGTKEGEPQDNNRGLKFSADATREKSIVQFEAIDGQDNKYYIKHVNSGMYYGQLSQDAQGALPVSKTHAGQYSPMDESTTDHSLLGLKEATNSQYVNIKISSDEGENYKLIGWNQNAVATTNSSIRIKPCESLEVALSAAGWSTYCSPVALTIPAVEGLHIYYVSSNQADAVYVKEITGIIPAKTPVLINGTASTTITFAIAEDVTAIEGNKLLGTTMRRNGFSTETSGNPDVYGLKISETTASFVPAYSATLPANKAVLPYENIDFTGMTGEAATNAFRLVSDDNGTTTGIAAAPMRHAGDNGLLRDLSGRVVAYPIAGQVYIKSNGQKIILK
ncbi:MAG: hypothetical protein ACI3X6_04730 [Alloprevotella sp.]